MARTPDTARGDALRRRLRALPPTTRRLVLAGVVLGWLAVWYLALLALNTWVLDEPDWTRPLSSMIGPLVGIAVVFWLLRRRLGSFRRVGMYQGALQRGRLPDDADPAEWGPLLERARGFQRGARSVALVLTVLAVVVVVIGFAWAGFGSIAVIVAALVGVAGVALLEWASRRQSAKADRLQEQVAELRSR